MTWHKKEIYGHAVAYCSMREGPRPIYIQIVSPSAFPWTPVPSLDICPCHARSTVWSTRGFPPLDQFDIRLGTCPREGAGHRVAQAKSAHLVLQRIESRILSYPRLFIDELSLQGTAYEGEQAHDKYCKSAPPSWSRFRSCYCVGWIKVFAFWLDSGSAYW